VHHDREATFGSVEAYRALQAPGSDGRPTASASLRPVSGH